MNKGDDRGPIVLFLLFDAQSIIDNIVDIVENIGDAGGLFFLYYFLGKNNMVVGVQPAGIDEVITAAGREIVGAAAAVEGDVPFTVVIDIAVEGIGQLIPLGIHGSRDITAVEEQIAKHPRPGLDGVEAVTTDHDDLADVAVDLPFTGKFHQNRLVTHLTDDFIPVGIVGKVGNGIDFVDHVFSQTAVRGPRSGVQVEHAAAEAGGIVFGAGQIDRWGIIAAGAAHPAEVGDDEGDGFVEFPEAEIDTDVHADGEISAAAVEIKGQAREIKTNTEEACPGIDAAGNVKHAGHVRHGELGTPPEPPAAATDGDLAFQVDSEIADGIEIG
ncbi:hypothetical protein DSCO28_34550 [Desulfosarcina ovata subsp. sediminis]|uniref:Uncharacterized protein n=1 Tax=Desulfosarcina ovata subsp. sediminis TaxID=885957 RepID=A0A5K7ZQS1_9BACT|nr:hypothetical protein DSCO28_34550 [Desulfosarcina ovata subsp. sediminis]